MRSSWNSDWKQVCGALDSPQFFMADHEIALSGLSLACHEAAVVRKRLRVARFGENAVIWLYIYE